MPYIRSGKALRFAALPLLVLTLPAGAFAAASAPFAAARAGTMIQLADGEAPTEAGPASQAHKQRTDGEAPTQVGPGSGAYNGGQTSR
jgi:hypothetical protein